MYQILTNKNKFKIDFIGIGPQRAGTTWMHQNLMINDKICFPEEVKETMFFELFYDKGLNWYSKHFKHKNLNQLYGEIGPTYFDCNQAPKRIRRLNPDCKIIINLRNPLDRTISLYRHHATRGRINCNFSEAIKKIPRILESGLYEKHLQKWFENFERNQIKIIIFDDIRNSPDKLIDELFKFLDLDVITLSSEIKKKIGAPTMPRSWLLANLSIQISNFLHSKRLHKVVNLAKSLGLDKLILEGGGSLPQVTKDEKKMIFNYFKSDIKYVEKVMGRELPSWYNIK